MDSVYDTKALPLVSCLIRKSPDQSLLPTPRGLSQVTTSFIAFQCLGIPRTLFVTSPKTFMIQCLGRAVTCVTVPPKCISAVFGICVFHGNKIHNLPYRGHHFGFLRTLYDILSSIIFVMYALLHTSTIFRFSWIFLLRVYAKWLGFTLTAAPIDFHTASIVNKLVFLRSK